MEKVSIFIDGSAMFFAQKANRWELDYEKVLQHFTDGEKLVEAWYFTASPRPELVEALNRYNRFRKLLITVGYNVKDKQVRQIHCPESGTYKQKGNLDIEIVFRMLVTADRYNTAILFSGDSDFIPIVEHLINTGKRVVVVGRRLSTAMDLRNIASAFVDLDNVREYIERR